MLQLKNNVRNKYESNIQLQKKNKYMFMESPTKNYNKEIDKRMHKFDINRVTHWTPELAKKFRNFVYENINTQDHQVVLNFMVYDRQI